MEPQEAIKLLNNQSAIENARWVEKNPVDACRLIWYLLGYSRLDGQRMKSVRKILGGNK